MTGGAGWLGLSLVERLLPEIESSGADLTLLGRRTRVVRLAGRDLLVQAWTPQVQDELEPTVLVHCAFVTREHLATMDARTYEDVNRRLTERGLDLARNSSVRAVVHTSSGAVTSDHVDLYGVLKRDEEVQFTALGSALPVVTARAFSVSGPLCPKPDTFAFTSFVRSAMTEGLIQVRADHEVWRRYVDAGEYMEIALRAAMTGRSEVIESGGDLIELHALARRIADFTRADIHEAEIAPWSLPDRYLSDSTRMMELAREVGVAVSDLDDQIKAMTAAFG